MGPNKFKKSTFKQNKEKKKPDEDSEKKDENKPLLCAVPSSCFKCTRPPIDLSNPDDYTKVVCTSSLCTQSTWMHVPCFRRFEEQAVLVLSKTGRGRGWSDTVRRTNVWSKNGYDLIFKHCSCDCGKGSLRKDIDFEHDKTEPQLMRREEKKPNKRDKAPKPELNFPNQKIIKLDVDRTVVKNSEKYRRIKTQETKFLGSQYHHDAQVDERETGKTDESNQTHSIPGLMSLTVAPPPVKQSIAGSLPPKAPYQQTPKLARKISAPAATQPLAKQPLVLASYYQIFTDEMDVMEEDVEVQAEDEEDVREEDDGGLWDVVTSKRQRKMTESSDTPAFSNADKSSSPATLTYPNLKKIPPGQLVPTSTASPAIKGMKSHQSQAKQQSSKPNKPVGKSQKKAPIAPRFEKKAAEAMVATSPTPVNDSNIVFETKSEDLDTSFLEQAINEERARAGERALAEAENRAMTEKAKAEADRAEKKTRAEKARQEVMDRISREKVRAEARAKVERRNKAEEIAKARADKQNAKALAESQKVDGLSATEATQQLCFTSPDSLASPLQTVPGFASSPQQQLNQGAAVNGAETYRPNSLALAQVVPNPTISRTISPLSSENDVFFSDDTDEDEMTPEEQKPAYKLQFGSGLSFLNNSGIGGGVSSSSNILLARPKGRQNSGYPETASEYSTAMSSQPSTAVPSDYSTAQSNVSTPTETNDQSESVFQDFGGGGNCLFLASSTPSSSNGFFLASSIPSSNESLFLTSSKPASGDILFPDSSTPCHLRSVLSTVDSSASFFRDPMQTHATPPAVGSRSLASAGFGSLYDGGRAQMLRPIRSQTLSPAPGLTLTSAPGNVFSPALGHNLSPAPGLPLPNSMPTARQVAPLSPPLPSADSPALPTTAVIDTPPPNAVTAAAAVETDYATSLGARPKSSSKHAQVDKISEPRKDTTFAAAAGVPTTVLTTDKAATDTTLSGATVKAGSCRDVRREATFQFVVNNFSSITDKAVLSVPTMIRNLPWRIMIMQKQTMSKNPAAVAATHGQPAATLFVGNFAHTTTDKHLRELFGKFGKIRSTLINKTFQQKTQVSNFGYVIFEERSSMEKALKSQPILDGKTRLTVEERITRRRQESLPTGNHMIQPKGVTKTLGFFLQCNGGDLGWNCHAKAQLRVLNQKTGSMFKRDISHLFLSRESDWGYSSFMSWSEVTDPNNGYIKDDIVIFEAHVTVDAPSISTTTTTSLTNVVGKESNTKNPDVSEDCPKIAVKDNGNPCKFEEQVDSSAASSRRTSQHSSSGNDSCATLACDDDKDAFDNTVEDGEDGFNNILEQTNKFEEFRSELDGKKMVEPERLLNTGCESSSSAVDNKLTTAANNKMLYGDPSWPRQQAKSSRSVNDYENWRNKSVHPPSYRSTPPVGVSHHIAPNLYGIDDNDIEEHMQGRRDLSNQINCVYCMVKYKSVVDFTAHCQTASHNNKKQIFKEQRLEAALLMAKAKAEKKAVENETVAATTTSASEAGNENSSKDVSDLPDITTAPVEVAGVTERGRSVCSKQDNHDGSTTGGGSGSSGGDSGAGSSPVRSSVCSSARSSPISELAGGNSSEGTVSTADSCITAYWEEFAAAQTSGTETDEESPSEEDSDGCVTDFELEWLEDEMKGIAEADAKPASFASQLVDLASLRRTTKPKKNSRRKYRKDNVPLEVGCVPNTDTFKNTRDLINIFLAGYRSSEDEDYEPGDKVVYPKPASTNGRLNDNEDYKMIAHEDTHGALDLQKPKTSTEAATETDSVAVLADAEIDAVDAIPVLVDSKTADSQKAPAADNSKVLVADSAPSKANQFHSDSKTSVVISSDSDISEMAVKCSDNEVPPSMATPDAAVAYPASTANVAVSASSEQTETVSLMTTADQTDNVTDKLETKHAQEVALKVKKLKFGSRREKHFIAKHVAAKTMLFISKSMLILDCAPKTAVNKLRRLWARRKIQRMELIRMLAKREKERVALIDKLARLFERHFANFANARCVKEKEMFWLAFERLERMVIRRYGNKKTKAGAQPVLTGIAACEQDTSKDAMAAASGKDIKMDGLESNIVPVGLAVHKASVITQDKFGAAGDKASETTLEPVGVDGDKASETTLEPVRVTGDEASETTLEVSLKQLDDQLEADNVCLAKRVSVLVPRNSQLVADKARLEERNRQFVADMASLEQQNSQLMADKASLQQQNSRLITDKASLEQHKSQLMADKVSLEQHNSQLMADKASLEQHNSQLMADKAKHEQHNSQLMADKVSLEQQNSRLKADKSSLEQQNSQLNADKASLEQKSRQLVSDKVSLEERIRTLMADKASLEQQNSQLDADKARFEERNRQLLADKASFEQQDSLLVADKSSQSEELQAEVASLRKENHKLSAKNRKLMRKKNGSLQQIKAQVAQPSTDSEHEGGTGEKKFGESNEASSCSSSSTMPCLRTIEDISDQEPQANVAAGNQWKSTKWQRRKAPAKEEAWPDPETTDSELDQFAKKYAAHLSSSGPGIKSPNAARRMIQDLKQFVGKGVSEQMETFRADMLETQADMLEKLKKERRDSMEDFKKVFQKELAADIKADLMVEFEAKMASEARLRREAEAGMTEEILTLRHQLAMDKAKSAQLCQDMLLLVSEIERLDGVNKEQKKLLAELKNEVLCCVDNWKTVFSSISGKVQACVVKEMEASNTGLDESLRKELKKMINGELTKIQQEFSRLTDWLKYFKSKLSSFEAQIKERQSGLLGDDPNPILLGMAVGNSPSPSNNEGAKLVEIKEEVDEISNTGEGDLSRLVSGAATPSSLSTAAIPEDAHSTASTPPLQISQAFMSVPPPPPPPPLHAAVFNPLAHTFRPRWNERQSMQGYGPHSLVCMPPQPPIFSFFQEAWRM